MEAGILYVVFNKWIRNPETNEMPYKIGITRNTVYDRYYGLGLKMPGKFETLFAYKFEDCAKAEQLIHGILNKFRESGEWFNICQKQLDLIRANCELMDGILVTDEVEIETETEANDFENLHENINDTINVTPALVVQPNILHTARPINPNYPCKIFIFPIQNAIAKSDSVYDSTRHWWRITDKYRNVSEYKIAVGLQHGFSLGAYKLTRWIYSQQYNKCEFEGDEITEFEHFTWHKQIDAVIGFWQRGNHLIVEFDRDGRFQLIRPDKRDVS
jgi:hypothetical protein